MKNTICHCFIDGYAKILRYLRVLLVYFKRLRLTFPSIRFPAAMGAKRPAKLAVQFVNDIKIPAKRGVMSKWLILKPEYIPPLRPIPMVRIATVNTRSHPVYEAMIRQMAGPYWPEINENNFNRKFKLLGGYKAYLYCLLSFSLQCEWSDSSRSSNRQ